MQKYTSDLENPSLVNVVSAVSYCFCTLAFGEPYRLSAKKFAQQLQSYDIKLVIATDKPQDFEDCSGVIAIKLYRTSILYPFNDKRFALEAALKHYECAVLVDADSEIVGEIPKMLEVPPGMYAITAYKSLEEDLKKHHPNNFPYFEKFAKKLGVELNKAQWVCENLIIIRSGENRELKFLDTWGFADRWLGIRRVFQSDHGYIGVAAASAGWTIYDHQEFFKLREIIKHQGHRNIGVTIDGGVQKNPIVRKIGFHWRLLKAYFRTLLEPNKYWF